MIMSIIKTLSIANQKKKGEFSVAQITPKVLKQYGINLDVDSFKGFLRHFPSMTITTGSPIDKSKQKHIKLYNLDEISYYLGGD